MAQISQGLEPSGARTFQGLTLSGAQTSQELKFANSPERGRERTTTAPCPLINENMTGTPVVYQLNLLANERHGFETELEQQGFKATLREGLQGKAFRERF